MAHTGTVKVPVDVENRQTFYGDDDMGYFNPSHAVRVSVELNDGMTAHKYLVLLHMSDGHQYPVAYSPTKRGAYERAGDVMERFAVALEDIRNIL